MLAPFVPSPSTGEARSALRPRSGARQGRGEGDKDDLQLTVFEFVALLTPSSRPSPTRGEGAAETWK